MEELDDKDSTRESFSSKEHTEALRASKERGIVEVDSLLEKKLEEAPLSTQEKIELILMREGLKPATEISLTSQAWYPGEGVKAVNNEETESIKTLLTELKLPYKVLEREVVDGTSADAEHGYQFPKQEEVLVLVGRDKEGLNLLKKAYETGKVYDYGKAYGFPQTAVEAFSKGGTLVVTELPGEVQQTDAYAFGRFVYSRKHWREELETGKKWAEVIKKYPSLYHQHLSEFRDGLKGLSS